MKFTENQYRKFILNEQSFFLRILHKIKVLKLEIIDYKSWNDNNDYNYNVKLVKLNPFTYIILIILIAFAFFTQGFNKKNFINITKELKSSL